MQYTYPIPIPANTNEANFITVDCGLCYGTLKKTSVYFPWGCAGLAHIRILHYEHQLYPTNLEGWLAGNEINIEFECDYEISELKTSFKTQAFNEDDFYAHTPIVSFVIVHSGEQFFYPSAQIGGF